ncbi:MAG TPA: GAF domain-containing protein [Anaerolineae bacterium]|nr:GAF domain-containing protein [Anaerolineae bacterium]HIQ09300.1 GAF domain-containing protein [Anaerolineaceae bacterium]
MSPQRRFWSPRLRTTLWGTGLLTLFVIALISGIMLYLTSPLRARMYQVLQTNQYTSLFAQIHLDTVQALLVTEEGYETRQAYQYQELVIPWATALAQDLQHIVNLRQQLGPEDPLYPYLTELEQYARDAVQILQASQRLAAQNRWEEVKAQIEKLHALERQARTATSILLSNTRQQSAQAAQATRALLLRMLLFIGGAMVIMAAALLSQVGLTLNRVVKPIESLTTYLARFAQGDLQVRAPEPASPLEIHQLAHTFNQMADQIMASQMRLEQQVAERTASLRSLNKQLQAAAEVGRAVASLSDLDEILQEATRLIAARFNVYHVGIFLLDASGTYAVLRAANSEGGRRMLRRGHRLKVGEEGIVGYVTGTGRPRIALDVGRDAVHFRNPDLPETRSEAALPLRIGNRVLGALDVQSTQSAAFSREELNTFQFLADLLAIAIHNAELLRQSQEAVEEMRRAYAQISQRGWEAFVRQRSVKGYRLDDQGHLQPIAETESTQPSPTNESAQVLQVPIEVRGVPVAHLRLRKPADRPWNAPERRLVQELSRRLSSALEGARLFTESQRRAAQLQAVAEIARDTSTTLDLETLLRSAVELVRERFGFYHASVFLIDEEGRYAEVRASTGEAGAEMLRRQHRLAVGSASVVGQAAARGEPVVVNDTRHSEIHHPNPLLPETRAELALPLKTVDTVIGALDVQATRPHAFSQDDVQVLQILADQLAVAVTNARLFAEVQEHLESHRKLHAILAAATATLTVEEALQQAAEAIHKMWSDLAVAFLLANPTQRTLRVVAAKGHRQREKALGMEVPYGHGITGWAAEHQEIVRSNRVQEDPRYIKGTPGTQSKLAIPLIYRDEMVAVMDLESPRPGAFDESDQELFRTLATSLAAVLTNIRLLEAARRRAEQLQLLNEISSIAATHVNQVELLQAVLPRLVEGLGGQIGGALLRTTGPYYKIVAAYPPGAQPIVEDLSDIVASALAQKRPIILPATEGLPPQAQPLAQQKGIQSIVMLPLLFREELVGALRIGLPGERAWSDEEQRLLEQIARQISTSLEAARLFEAATRRARRERLVTEITTRMRASNDPQEILQTALRELQKALQAEITQVVILENGENLSEA